MDACDVCRWNTEGDLRSDTFEMSPTWTPTPTRGIVASPYIGNQRNHVSAIDHQAARGADRSQLHSPFRSFAAMALGVVVYCGDCGRGMVGVGAFQGKPARIQSRP